MTTARHIRWLCLFSIAAAVGLSCGTGATPPAPREIALEDVREEVRQIIDPTRATPANGDFAGRPERLLETRIWSAEEALARPACRGGRCGLILLAHGFGGNTGRFDAIGQRLAAAGYLVAAVQFPLTNDQAPGGYSTGGIDLQAQPQDLSAVLDALLAANRDPQDSLFQRIDEERVGAMGHSAGGTTLLANTRLSCCIDTRIRATAYVEPAATFVAALFGENYSARGPPTLTLQGEVDFPITPEASREFNASLEPPKILVEMSGGNHVNIIERFSEEPDPLLEDTAEIMIAFFDAFLAEHPQGLEPALESMREHGHTAVVDLDGSEEPPSVQG